MSNVAAVTGISKPTLFNHFRTNFGDPIGHVDDHNFGNQKGIHPATLFWAPCDYWNETLLRGWLSFPVPFIGPMMGNDVSVLKKNERPAGGGFVVYLIDEEAEDQL